MLMLCPNLNDRELLFRQLITATSTEHIKELLKFFSLDVDATLVSVGDEIRQCD